MNTKRIKHTFARASKVNHASIQNEIHPRRSMGGKLGRAKNLKRQKNLGKLHGGPSQFIFSSRISL